MLTLQAGPIIAPPHAYVYAPLLPLPLLLPLHSYCWDNLTVGYRGNVAQEAEGQIRDELSRCMHSEGGARIVFLACMATSALRTLHPPALHPSAGLGGWGAFSPSQPLVNPRHLPRPISALTAAAWTPVILPDEGHGDSGGRGIARIIMRLFGNAAPYSMAGQGWAGLDDGLAR